MVNIMTSLKLYALLAVFDLFGILVTTWIGILPNLVCFILLIMVCISLIEMIKGFNMREEVFSAKSSEPACQAATCLYPGDCDNS